MDLHLPLIPTLALTGVFALMAAAAVGDELARRRGIRRRAEALRSYVTRQTVIADPAAEAGSSATPGSNVALQQPAPTVSAMTDNVYHIGPNSTWEVPVANQPSAPPDSHGIIKKGL